MFSIIKPEVLDIWCDNSQSIPDNCEIPIPELPKSKWEKLKSKVTEICEAVTPVINTFALIVRTASMAVNAFCRFQACRRQKRNKSWVMA